MSADAYFPSRKVKSTRKDHVCMVCDKTIPKGSPAERHAQKYDGMMWWGYVHIPACRMVDEYGDCE